MLKSRSLLTDFSSENSVPGASEITLLYEKGWLIGEFTVEKYIYLERPLKTKYEKQLYELVSYPVTIDETPLIYDEWLKGHIIYSNFKVYAPRVDFKILGRNMSRGGSLNLTFDELQLIRGQRKL